MLKLIVVVVACFQAVSAFTCPEDSDTFYHADVSTGCQVYHLCQNSQMQTLTCPSGQAFNYATFQCEDASTVNCIETMGDHSHHHHHHKRSAEAEVVEPKPEILDQMIKKKPPSNFPKEKRRFSGIAVAGIMGTIDRLFTTTLIYCKHYGSCSASIRPNVTKSEMEFINRERSLAIFELCNPHMNIYVLKKEFDDKVAFKTLLRYIFSEQFNINEDSFLSFIFDDIPLIEKDSHQHHKRSVKEEPDVGNSKHFKSTVGKAVQEKRGKNFQTEKRRDSSLSFFFDDIPLIEKGSHQHHKRSVKEEPNVGDSKHFKSTVDKAVQEKRGKNFQTEKRRDSSLSFFFSLLSNRILAYCKHYESCNSSIHANVSRSDREVINRERSAAAYPTADIIDLKNYLDNSGPVKDLFREGFAEIFNISKDAFLSYFFDNKPFIRGNFPKHAKPVTALFLKKSTKNS